MTSWNVTIGLGITHALLSCLWLTTAIDSGILQLVLCHPEEKKALNDCSHLGFLFPAVQIHILKADKAGEWWKFTVNIISVYKQGTNRIRRGDQILWIRSKDVACKCPKIKPMKKYLLLGHDEDSPDQNGIVADKSSLVIQWRDTWARRLRKFQQREKKGKCKKA